MNFGSFIILKKREFRFIASERYSLNKLALVVDPFLFIKSAQLTTKGNQFFFVAKF